MERTIIVPDGGSNGFGNGMEGMMLGSMLGCGGMGMGGGAWMNNPIWALAFMRYFDNENYGHGGRNSGQLDAIQERLNTIQGQNALMSAIQGGTNEVRSLTSTLGCDFNAVQAAINGVQSAICNVGSQNGMNFMQVLNAVSSGQRDIINQFQSCCCTIQTDILKQTNQLDRSIERVNDSVIKAACDTAYATKEQTCALQLNNDANTRTIIGKLDAMERQRLDEKIEALTAANSVLQARAERQAEIAPVLAGQQALAAEIASLKCHLPETKVITCPTQYLPVNYDINVPLTVGRAGCGYNYGAYPYVYPNAVGF